MPGRIPVVLCIDVEPDGFFIDPRRRDPWVGFERSVELFGALRATLCQETDTTPHFTWTVRTDPQAAHVYGRADWAPVTYASHFDTLQAHGDDIGVHSHAYRWDPASSSWTLDYGDAAWVEHCVRTSCAAFEGAFGRRCRTFRFGDRWTSDATVRLLEALGVRYDLTLEPGLPGGAFGHHGDRITGALPSLADVPATPYQPSVDDFRREAARRDGMWMVPLPTAAVRPAPWRRLAYRLLRDGVAPTLSTLLLSHEPRLFARIVDEVLARRGARSLTMAVRSNASASPRLVGRIRANVETLRRHPLAKQFVWVTPVEMVALLRPPDGAIAAGQA